MTNAKPIRVLSSLLLAVVLACGLTLPTSLANAGEQTEGRLAASTIGSQEDAAGANVDDIVSRMTLDEKISQMIIPAIRTWNEKAVTDLSAAPELASALQKHQYGGIILYGSNVTGTEQVARLVWGLQANNAKIKATTNIPYLMPVDEEGGVVTRLASGTRMTGSMAIGATGDKAEQYAEATGEIIGEELEALGFNADFAPVIDVNCNPANPVIGTRSFSDDPDVVSALGAAFGRGLARSNVIATYKHFPGHGDTATDSHTGLPSVDKTREQFDETEFVPFRRIVGDAAMIMTAHIVLPQVDEQVDLPDGSKGYYPATMSKKILDGILRGEMGYDGVVITDALEMDALYSARFVEGDNGAVGDKPGTAKTASTEYKINLAAAIINAGTDILLLPADLINPDAAQFYDDYIAGIEAKVKSGAIPIDRIDESVTRILEMKRDYGILEHDAGSISDDLIDNALETVGSEEHHEAEMDIAQEAVTMVKNEQRTLPLHGDECNIVIVGRTKADSAVLSFAVEDMQDLGYLDPDARIVNLATGATTGSEGALTTVTIGYYYDFGDAVNPKVTPELEAAIADADEVVCLSTNWGLSTLQPTNAQYKGVKAVLDAARAANAATVLLSCNLPYDAARFKDDADAIVLCYMSSGTDVDPTARNESTGGGANAYNANIIAALDAMFAPNYLSDFVERGPQGHLPVNIPAGVVADDGAFSYSKTETLYKRGYGMTYADTPGVDGDSSGDDMPTGEKAANSLSVKPAQAKITAATNKQTVIEASEAFEVVKNESKGELTYEKVKGNAKIAVSANGDLTIAKGLKKGKTYAVTANVSSAETGEYQAATTDVKIKVRAKAPNKLKVAPAKGAFTATSSTKTIIPAKDAFKVKKNTGGGELAYKKVKGNAKIKVSNRGKVTITKGLEKGKTFTVTVNASSAETVEYLSAETAVKLKVKVK